MKIINGDSLVELKNLPENSVDSIVTDPPYGLSFMGKKWDYDVPSVELWVEAMRVLKPGGHLLSFAGSRTYHRMAVNIEDAGFEIRDQIMWVYGSGFPKSHNIGKAVDKLQGNVAEELPTEPMITGTEVGAISKNRRCSICKKAISSGNPCQCDREYKANNDWKGWGTALKPAHEPIVVARKPLSESTITKNVLEHGTGGINIDECRVETDEVITNHSRGSESAISKGKYGDSAEQETHQAKGQQQGRFPANLIHDGSDEVVDCFPEDSQRFFYCPKASKKDRNEGLEDFGLGQSTGGGGMNNTEDDVCGKYGSIKVKAQNFHPTVKPTALMQYLVRLVTPKGGTVLDPFMGSGSTGKACVLEGFDFIGIDLDPEYCKIAEARIKHAQAEKEKEQPKLL